MGKGKEGAGGGGGWIFSCCQDVLFRKLCRFCFILSFFVVLLANMPGVFVLSSTFGSGSGWFTIGCAAKEVVTFGVSSIKESKLATLRLKANGLLLGAGASSPAAVACLLVLCRRTLGILKGP